MVDFQGGFEYALEKTGLFGGIDYDKLSQQAPSFIVYQSGSYYIARPSPGAGLSLVTGTEPGAVMSSALSQLTLGGRLFIRAGTYPMLTRLIIPFDNIQILGAGFATKLQEVQGANLQGVIYGNSRKNILIRDLQIDGQGFYQTSDNEDTVCISFQGSLENITLAHCYLHDGRAGNIHIRTSGVADVLANGIRVLNNVVGKSYLSADSCDNIFVANANDVLIEGNSVTDSAYIGIVGGSGGCKNIRIAYNRVHVTSGKAGIFEDGSAAAYLVDVVIAGNTITGTSQGNGIELGFYVEQVIVEGNTIYGVLNGVRVINSREVTVSGNAVRACQRYGVEVQNSTSVIISDNQFRENSRESSSYSDVTLNVGSKGVRVSGNRFENRLEQGDSYGFLVDVGQSTVSDVSIEDNDFYNLLEGIRILAGSNYAIVGNVVRYCPRIAINVEGVSHGLISSNIIRDCGRAAVNTYSGISLGGAANDWAVTGNSIRDSQTPQQQIYGIEEIISGGNTPNYNTFVGNDCRLAGTLGGIRVLGANSHMNLCWNGAVWVP